MKLFVAVCLLGLLVATEAVPEAVPQQLPHRKLAQRGPNSRGYDPRRRSYPDQQFARNQAAAINTQNAIRTAEASGADPWATQGATYVGSTNAYLAAQRSNLVFSPLARGKR